MVNLVDLDQGQDYVRGKIGDYLADLVNLGAAGFRVDACKHMWPGDLEVIFGNLPNTKYGGKPFVAQEVIDQDRIRFSSRLVNKLYLRVPSSFLWGSCQDRLGILSSYLYF